MRSRVLYLIVFALGLLLGFAVAQDGAAEPDGLPDVSREAAQIDAAIAREEIERHGPAPAAP